MTRIDPAAAQVFAAGLREKIGEDTTATAEDVEAVESYADDTEETGVVPDTA